MRMHIVPGHALAAVLLLPLAGLGSAAEAVPREPLPFQRTAVIVAVRPPVEATAQEATPVPAGAKRVVVVAVPGDRSEHEQRLARDRTDISTQVYVRPPGYAEGQQARRIGEEALVRELGSLGPRATYGSLESGTRTTEAALRAWAAEEGCDGLVLLKVLEYDAKQLPPLGGSDKFTLEARNIIEATVEAVVTSVSGEAEPWRRTFRVRSWRDRGNNKTYEFPGHPLDIVLPEAAAELAKHLRSDGLLAR